MVSGNNSINRSMVPSGNGLDRNHRTSRCQIKRSHNRARNTSSKDGGLRIKTPRLQADDDQQDHNLADLLQGAENVPGLAADMLV